MYVYFCSLTFSNYYTLFQKMYNSARSITPQLPFLLLLLLCPLLTTSRQLQVPVIKDSTQRDIKLGRLEQVKQPQYDFARVQSRQVFKADTEMTAFQPCHENKPEVEFSILDRVIFDNHPEKPLVLYKFEDIQYSQYLLDAYLDGDTVYMMFEDAMAATVVITSEGRKKDYKLFNVSKLENGTKLEPGYFVKIGDQMIFMNNKYAIGVGKSSAIKLDGYQGGRNFITAISIDNQYIAIAFEETGIVFYWYSNQKLESFAYLPPMQISTGRYIQLSDLAYYSELKALLVLDEDQGVLSFTIEKIQEKDIKISAASILLKRESCDLMNLHQKNLYVVCGQVYKVSLQNWPRVEQKTLPHPNLKIRQIYIQGPLIAFVGRNIFKLMYMGRLVNYFQDQRMDKLIFHGDIFLSANQGSLLIGKYNIIQPYITCQTNYEEMVGSHPLIFKTTAECNDEFFNKYNIKMTTLNAYTEDDSCIYTVQRTVYFWKTGEIMILPILIVLILLIVIGLGVFGIWLLKKFSIRRVQRELEEYTSLTGVEGGKHQELVEEQPESSGNNQSGASNKMEDDGEIGDGDKKRSEIEMHNHDIQ